MDQAVAPTVVVADDQAKLDKLANRLLDASCPQPGDRLCALQSLANLSVAIADPESPAANAIGSIWTSAARPTQSERQALHDRLWLLTRALARAQVAAMTKHHPLSPLWQLRLAMSSARSSHEQAATLREWMALWPGHPLSGLPPTGLAKLLGPNPQPERVGIFVPLSGALSAAGRAARDGYIAAWLDDPAPNKLPIRVYDTAARPLGEIYEQSLADGIDLIVGPLSKQRLEALRALNPKVAVLGLNYLDAATCAADPVGANSVFGDPNPANGTVSAAGNPVKKADCEVAGAGLTTSPNGTIASQSPATGPSPTIRNNTTPQPKFLQVGLAIEDEAATIASRLQADGLHRLIAIHGGEAWAARGVHALANAWPADIEVHEFADVQTLTESIGGAMQVIASTERKNALETLLKRSLEFLPRRRSDIDGIVAFVDHIEASALAPALKFHFAGDLPVYASSLSIRNASALAELGGFQVVAMPLDLYSNALWDSFKNVFNNADGNIAALQALGMDAYRIVALGDWVLRGEPVYGATGALRLDDNGRVRRALAWASVSRGGIRPTHAGTSVRKPWRDGVSPHHSNLAPTGQYNPMAKKQIMGNRQFPGITPALR